MSLKYSSFHNNLQITFMWPADNEQSTFQLLPQPTCTVAPPPPQVLVHSKGVGCRVQLLKFLKSVFPIFTHAILQAA